MFVDMLRYKAESAGGELNEFPVSNALSQVCHGCGKKKKKKLNTRWHTCDCGVVGQRDLYSAFLASNVVGNGLDLPRAEKAWASAEPLLLRAMSRLNETATGKARLSSFGLNRSQSCWYAEGVAKATEVKDVVPESSSMRESLEKVA